MKKQFYRPDEAAWHLGVSRRSVYRLIQNGNSISGSYHGEANAFRSMFTCSITGTASGLSATLTCNSARGYYYEAGWYPLPNLEGYLFTMTLVNDGNILRGNGHDFIRQ